MNTTVVKKEAPEAVEPEEVEDVEEIEKEEEEEEGDADDWEEITMVVTVNGILDADLVREAVQKNNIKLRYAETEAPVLQINNSLYTGTWNQDLGTNIVFQTTRNKELEVISCTSTTLIAEKALLTSVSTDGSAIATKADSTPMSALSRTQTR